MNRAVFEVRKSIKDRGISQNAAAALVGADSGNFSKLLKDEGRGVSLKLALAIEREFGVPAPWWDEQVDDDGAPIEPKRTESSQELRAVDSPLPASGTEDE